MNMKILGVILMVVGTTIGGGVLGLPLATAQCGFVGAIILLISCWAVMTLSALLVLEANLWFPEGSNMLSMTKQTLGKWGESISWFIYLSLFYSLLAAYTSSGSDVLQQLLSSLHINIPHILNSFLFVLIFGSVVYLGIESIDYVNRGLMSVKMGAFVLLIFLIIPHVHYPTLENLDSHYFVSALTIVILSFGFASIIPSLRYYLKSDVQQLRTVIIIGSTIPLIFYILWVAAILGDIPLKGTEGLLNIIHSSTPTTSLVKAIELNVSLGWVSTAAHVFTSVCVATSFLGVSLLLSDFLSDGLKLKKQGIQKIILYTITLIPPFFIAEFYPKAFLVCLSYGGFLCMILLLILPAFIVWRGRYTLNIPQGNSKYQVMGGKITLLMIIIIGFLGLVNECIHLFKF